MDAISGLPERAANASFTDPGRKRIEAEVERLFNAISIPADTRDEIRAALDDEITTQAIKHSRLLKRVDRRMSQLGAERDRALRAYYADAISVELLRQEQTRIDAETQKLREAADLDVGDLENARGVADRALKVAARCGKEYAAAGPEERQRWNQVFFKKIVVGDRQVKSYEYQEPFATLFSWTGSNKEGLVSQEV